VLFNLLSVAAVLCAGAGSSAHNESETIAKYEIMDGAPVRGENIPIRSARRAAANALLQVQRH
jgi:hypothetical protein